MLSYEPGEIERYGLSKARLRLIALRYAQNVSLRRDADGAIFLTRYAGNVIQQSCGELRHVACVPHGVGTSFQSIDHSLPWPDRGERPIRCLYISGTLPYKHQWHVVEAIAQLRKRGLAVQLDLVGGGEGKAQMRLERQIARSDPKGEFVAQYEFVPQHTLPDFFSRADVFIFASSCESMPNTLMKAMAVGLPIACSDRGPMPEVLQDGGVYFNPESPDSVAAAILELIINSDKRLQLATRAKYLSSQYSWQRCAHETFSCIAQTAKRWK